MLQDSFAPTLSTQHDTLSFCTVISLICTTWYAFVWIVTGLGYYQIRRYYSHKPQAPKSISLENVPHVTLIRPIKGYEPFLYDCLVSSFKQTYPCSKLTIFLCIESREEACMPVLHQLLKEFPKHDVHIVVEKEDPLLQNRTGLESGNLGLNPKIRNMSQAYRRAIGDVIWVLDCNVWVNPGTAGRMVDKLFGLESEESRPYKFVHLLPLVVDTTEPPNSLQTARQTFGSRLEEMFLSSSHAKFYSAINTVSIAPCVVGKSNMFRKSHLDSLTPPGKRAPGLDYFSDFACEDHLIGDMLWKGILSIQSSFLPAQTAKYPSARNVASVGNHALAFGDLAIQPVSNMKTREFVARRVRWLRVRKYTVLLATLVEPGTECLLCSAYGAFAVSFLGPLWFEQVRAFVKELSYGWWVLPSSFFALSIVSWSLFDWSLYKMIHSGVSIEADAKTPRFARGREKSGGERQRPWTEWIVAWAGRELLALPIWVWAVCCGSTVSWRGKVLYVKMDMRVKELKNQSRDTMRNTVSKKNE